MSPPLSTLVRFCLVLFIHNCTVFVFRFCFGVRAIWCATSLCSLSLTVILSTTRPARSALRYVYLCVCVCVSCTSLFVCSVYVFSVAVSIIVFCLIVLVALFFTGLSLLTGRLWARPSGVF